MNRLFPYLLLSIMLLSAACEVIVHACNHFCEVTELATESNEEKGKEESENTKEVFAWREHFENQSAITHELGARQSTQFIVHSAFNEIALSLPELPPEI